MLNKEEKLKVRELLYRFKDIFALNKHDYGLCKNLEHEIDLKNNTPVQQLIGKVPLNVEKWVDQQVENLKDKGIIRESISPWSAPIVVAKKKGGDLRMCIDYRRLNSVTIRPTYNIPSTESLFNHLSNSKIFSTIDVSNAYYQCQIREKDKQLTAFSTRKGHFEFNRMPFGLVGAPFTFQRLITSILRNEIWEICLIYLDDILIFSDNFEEHLIRVQKVLEKIRQSGLKLSLPKCHFFLSEVNYLEHIVSGGGLKTDPQKIEVVKNWPLPETVSNLRSFLGFANYYRRFIKSYANLTNPLQEIMKDSCKSGVRKNDESKLLWSNEGRIAYDDVKNALCTAPCLSFPRPNSTYILDTDASFYALGCVLSQTQKKEEKVIAYGSKKLSKSDLHYCIKRKELLSVYHFVTHFRQFLLGTKFIIRTDHRALKWLLNWNSPNTSQYCSWIAELEIYDFIIEHRQGTKHINADFLSRPSEQCKQCEISHDDPKPKRNVKVFQITNQNTCSKTKIKKVHHDLGHIGEVKLLGVIKEMGMKEDHIRNVVHDVVKECLVCSERKSPGRQIGQKLAYSSNEI